MMDDGDELQATWGRRGKTEARAPLRTFNGARYFHVRLWTTNSDGQTVATPKGVCVPVKHLAGLDAALHLAEQRLGEGAAEPGGGGAGWGRR